MTENKLVEWVLANVEQWREHRDSNYLEKWKEYERIWRGVWEGSDKTRESERSRFISPATQQAVENHVSEIEEAIFGQGDHLFDIEDDMMDQEKTDVEYLKNYMKDCFKKNKIRKSVGDINLLAAVYGTGIGEILLKKTTELVPATRPMDNVDAVQIGVEKKEKIGVYLLPINPQNFLIDPNATTIEDALGVAVEQFVSAHLVAQKVKEGVYKDTKIEGSAPPDDKLEPTSIDQQYHNDKVKLIRYYGLVPKELLDNVDNAEFADLFDNDDGVSDLMDEYGDMVEAIVVIGNDNMLLKAEETPFMMKDRPLVAYQDDTVPNRFWGRGVVEKAYNSQKGLDAQLRSHFDSLALTTAPMMGIDATRLPRGSKFEVRPGKSVLTNGNPQEILMPFKFGVTDGSSMQTAQELERMLLQATGTMDTAATQTQPVGGELSITLSGILKKNKRTLVNFQDQFLIPFVEKAAWRFMQYDPEHFPVKDFKFIPASTLGMLAREVEQQQFINLMKTLGPDSPLVPILMQGVIENSSLSNKNTMLEQLKKSMEPDPKQQQVQQAMQQLEMAGAMAEVAKTKSEIMVNQTQALKNQIDAQVKPEEAKAKLLAAINENIPDEAEAAEREFDRRVRVAELMLKEQDLDQNVEIVNKQMELKQSNG
jgi:hypothetical protein